MSVSRSAVALSILVATVLLAGCGSESSSTGSGGTQGGTAPQIASFTATPASVGAGAPVTLSWSVAGAASLSIDQGVGTVTGTSRTVTPSATTIYTLTATNDSGSSTASVAVTVVAIPAPVINSFTASPSTILPGQSAVLAWSVSGASSVSIDQGVGTVTGSSTTVSPSATTTYTVTATNASGSTTSSVTVTVSAAPVPVINSFTASPSSVLPGESSVLAWSIVGAASVSINQAIGAVTGSSATVTPVGTTTYTLTATNASGSSTASVTVSVSPPRIAAFTASPSTIAQGASSVLAWSVAGATSVSIGQGVGTVTGSSVSVSPASTTTYTMTATNESGSSTASATVTVSTSSLTITPLSNVVPPSGSIPLAASGGSGAGYAWSVIVNASGGTIGPATGAYVAGLVGGVTDVVRVVDSAGNTATTNVTVTPGVAISPATRSIVPRGSATFSASGGSGAGYTWTLSVNASGGTIDASSGAYVAGPTPSVTDVVRVTDSLGNVATRAVAVGPGVAIAPASTGASPLGSVSFSASGGSGAGYAWSFVVNASGGTLNSTTGAYVAGSAGGTTDIVRATDSLGNVGSAVVSVTTGISITATATTIPPRGSIVFDAQGGSGTGYTWSLPTNASGGAINPSSGVYSAGPGGSVTDVVRVVDSLGNVASQAISVTEGVAVMPAFANVLALSSVAFTATGGSGTGYAWSLATNASGGSINPSTGLYTAGPTGGVTDVIRVVDSLGNVATGSVVVTPLCTWQQVASHSLTTAPAGSVLLNGASGNQGPATVYGRSAWYQQADWNYLLVPLGALATADVVAVEADTYAPTAPPLSTGIGLFALNAFGENQSGITADLGWTDTAPWSTQLNVGSCTSPGVATVTHAESPSYFGAWHRLRVEAVRSLCRFRVLVDGVELYRWTYANCDTRGTYVNLMGGNYHSPAVAANVAWSSVTLYGGSATACVPPP